VPDGYTPTTEEIRDYVEVGGEPRPWMPPEPAKDAARASAFDRWLAAHDAETRRDQALTDALIADKAGRRDIGQTIIAPYAIKRTPSPETEQER